MNDINVPVFLVIVIGLVVGAVAFAVGYFVRKNTAEKEILSAEFKAKEIVAEAAKSAESVKKEKVLEAKE